MNQFKKTKKLAIVTGSAGGIGSAICSKLIKENYEVIGIDLSSSNQSKKISFIKFDLEGLTNQNLQSEEFLELLISKIGNRKIDLLVNNAAVQIKDNLNNFNLNNWKKTMAINLEAPLILIEKLKDKFHLYGVVINMSSIHANLTKENFLSYSVSKSALSALTRALAVNYGKKLRFIGIQPAAIQTDMLEKGFGRDFKNKIKELKEAHPSKLIGEAFEVAELVNAVASRDLKFLNGSIINIDGGISSRLHDPE